MIREIISGRQTVFSHDNIEKNIFVINKIMKRIIYNILIAYYCFHCFLNQMIISTSLALFGEWDLIIIIFKKNMQNFFQHKILLQNLL